MIPRYLDILKFACLYLICTVIINPELSAQDFRIQGIISNHQSKDPLPFVNVFFNNTQIGTTTNNFGEYELDHLDSGSYNLIVSMVGFKTVSKNIRLKDVSTLVINIELEESITALETLEFIGENDKEWAKNYRIFEREFFGTREGFSNYELTNPYVLEFHIDKDKNKFVAIAQAPLVIKNQDLGYQVYFYLQNFEKNNLALMFYGQNRFEELEYDNPEVLDTWLINRQRAYLGSIRHFFRSLINGSYKEEGFMAYKINTIHDYQPTNTFYDKVGKQYIEIDPKKIVEDSDIASEKIISFKGELIIVFTHNEWLKSPFPDLSYQVSWIRLKVPKLRVHESGYVNNPSGFEVAGYSGEDRLLQMLPFEYDPAFSKAVLEDLAIPNQIQSVFEKEEEKLKTNRLLHNLQNIVVHTDKPVYSNRDEIHLSFHLLNVGNNQFINGTEIIYTDLINEENQLISTSKFRSVEGIATGRIQLSEELFNGCYRLRSYTKRMANYSSQTFSNKIIQIVSPLNKYFENEEINQSMDSLHLQVFPEGGSIISNLNNHIVIKTTNYLNKGIKTKGKLQDEKGKQVAEFTTNELGFGDFEFKPKKQGNYYIVVNIGSKEFQYLLPKVNNSGFNISIDPFDSKNIKTYISATKDQKDDQFILMYQSNGKIFHKGLYQLENYEKSIELPREKFPEGIIEVRILDVKGYNIGHRYIYNTIDTSGSGKVIIDLEEKGADKKILISLQDHDTNPQPGYFSVSITKNDLFYKNTFNNCINKMGELILEQQFLEEIEKPGEYFKDHSPESIGLRDQLMISLKKYIFNPEIHNNYKSEIIKRESKLLISGTALINNKPCETCLMQIFPLETIDQAIVTYTDEFGKFKSSELIFFDSASIAFTVLDKTGKPAKANIIIDEFEPPPIAPLSIQCYESDFSEDYSTFMDSLRALHAASEIVLLEGITVEEAALPLDEDDGIYRAYGSPDAVVEVEDKDKHVTNVLQYLQGKVAGVMVNQYTDPSTGRAMYNVQIRGRRSINLERPPLYLIDGNPFIGDISTINPTDVKRIEILKNPANVGIYGVRGASGIIAIYTETEANDYLINDQNNLAIKKLVGYSDEMSAQGYSPDSTDISSLIYWNPNLTTNENGEVQLEFTDLKLPEKYTISIQGVTTNGFPFYKQVLIEEDKLRY